MTVRNTFAKVLALALFVLSGSLDVQAATDLRAMKCIESYLSHYSQIKKYKTILLKKEWNEGGDLIHDERIALSFSKPAQMSFTYLNPGSTGIRNNGMRVDYDGGLDVRIQLGTSSGLGLITKGVASALVGSRQSLYDARVIDDEIFTINRAGFDFLSQVLKRFLPTLKVAQKGGLRLIRESGCRVKYLPHEFGDLKVEVKPEDSIFELEEKQGVLAYLIYQRNKDQLSHFHDLFVREKHMTLQVPKSFFEFDLDLNPETQFPDQLLFYYSGKQIAQYQFKDLEVFY